MRVACLALAVAALCAVGGVADDMLQEQVRPLRVGAGGTLPSQPRMARFGGFASSSSLEESAAAARAGRGAAEKPLAHSEDFLLWARRFHKLKEYCGGAPLPCEESLYREGVWRENQRHIEEHNAKTGSLMKKGLTRFADLSVEEFSTHHATYSAPMLKNEAKDVRKGLINPDMSKFEREKQRDGGGLLKKVFGGIAEGALGAAPKEEATAAVSEEEGNLELVNGNRGGNAAAAEKPERQQTEPSSTISSTSSTLSLKAATDAAAAAGERLPSEGGGVNSGIFGRVFPSLGASGSLNPSERQRRQNRRRAMKQRLRAGLDLGGPLGTGLPKHHNWGDKINFGEIIHQGTCAGCWAYSTAAVVEAAQFISSGVHQRLSPYSLIDCDNLDHGCMTGNMASAYAWIQTSRHGIPKLGAYPERRNNGCDRPALGMEPGTRTKGYCDLPVLSRDSERQMLEALWQQPVAVGVNIHALQFYESGIVKKEDCPPADSNPLKAINHAAVLTGWGYDESSDQYYWILRNTYGDHWGEDGYARLAFGQDENNFGTCALYTEGNFPLVGNLSCTPSSVRKEAVKHGKHVWLYPGGYNMGPHDAGGLDLRGASSLLGENMQSAVLVTACGLVAASTVVMAAQAMALSRIRRDNNNNRQAAVTAVAESISKNRTRGGGGESFGGGDGACGDLEKGGLLVRDGAGGAPGGRYGTSSSPLESDTY